MAFFGDIRRVSSLDRFFTLETLRLRVAVNLLLRMDKHRIRNTVADERYVHKERIRKKMAFQLHQKRAIGQ
jgi:hypothetical protein